MSELTVPARSAVDPQYTWNAASVFPSTQAWEAEAKAVEADLEGLATLKGVLPSEAAALAAVFKKIEDIRQRAMKVMVYASMSYAVDTGDQAAAGMYDRAMGLLGKVQGAGAFVDPGLLAIGREALDRMMYVNSEIEIYGHYFDDLFRQQAHVRSAEVEELLGQLATPFSGPNSIYSAMTDADFKFRPAIGHQGQEIPLAQGSIDAILAGSDREARRTAWENYADIYLSFKNTLSNTLSASIKQNTFATHARRYPSTLEGALFDDNIPAAVFHNLINVFKQNLPVWHRYWRLRRQTLGVAELHPYDILCPLTSSQPRIEYSQAVEMVCSGLAPLGSDYTSAIRKGCLEERWVDVYPNQGKMAGAFSSGAYGTHPFINMSFSADLTSLSTLAHELGHSMHSYLTQRHQPFIYSDYSLFVAEVASNFHQAMVRGNLLKTSGDPAFRIAVIEEAMANFHRYFFIMPTLARFELELHQRVERGEGLTADDMIGLMADLFAEGYGQEMHLDRERIGITWATFGHLYRDYYVFQYGTGISAANVLAKRILNGVPGAAENYLKFLSAGSSVYPLEALKIAGVDLALPQAVEETFGVLRGYVETLEGLLIP